MAVSLVIGHVNNLLLSDWSGDLLAQRIGHVKILTSCYLIGSVNDLLLPHWSMNMPVNCLFIGQYRFTWPPHWYVNDLLLPHWSMNMPVNCLFYWSVQIYLATSLVMSMTYCSLIGHASKQPFYWSVQIYLATSLAISMTSCSKGLSPRAIRAVCRSCKLFFLFQK